MQAAFGWNAAFNRHHSKDIDIKKKNYLINVLGNGEKVYIFNITNGISRRERYFNTEASPLSRGSRPQSSVSATRTALRDGRLASRLAIELVCPPPPPRAKNN